MFCSYCKRDNPDDKIFCLECGERLYTDVLINYVRMMDDDEYEIFVGNYVSFGEE